MEKNDTKNNETASEKKLTPAKQQLKELREKQTEARLEFEAARQKLLDSYREKLKAFQKQRAEIYAGIEASAKVKKEAEKSKPALASASTGVATTVVKAKKSKEKKTEKIASEVVVPEVVSDSADVYVADDEPDQLAEALKKLAAM